MDIQKHFIATIVAAPKQGKTHLINYLLYDLIVVKKMFNAVIVYTLSPHYYYGIVPDQFINTTYSDEKFKKVMEYQESQPDSELLIIFDDFMGMIKNFHQQNSFLTQQLTRYRHPNTHFSCIFAMHLANHVSLTIRTISSYCI